MRPFECDYGVRLLSFTAFGETKPNKCDDRKSISIAALTKLTFMIWISHVRNLAIVVQTAEGESYEADHHRWRERVLFSILIHA